MPRLLRSRYLVCFYCGRKNSTLYEGGTRRFDCPYCDATNYLDERGDITDPPVATEKEATPRQFAVARAVSPPSSPSSSSIFCAKCLKNQHLLSASLAQYLPDPDDPDYAEREQGLHRFRKIQERLYPQICADCEPKVRTRLEQAAYTAKTDLLRRMIDRSATANKTAAAAGWLERFDTAGLWLWIAGFVLQLAWHAVVVHSLLSQYLAWAEADESLFTVRMLAVCGPLVGSMPSPERLLGWSTLASILGVWWNPRFAQVSRGFTRHISGVWRWYFVQAVAVVLRVGLRKMDLANPDPLLLSNNAAGHALAATVAILIFTVGPRCIRINMAPLFGTSSQPLKLDDSPGPTRSTRPDETKSIADLLDEISRSPTSPIPPSPVEESSPSIPRRTTNFLPMGHAHRQAAQALTANLQQINGLHLSQQNHSSRPPPAYSEEMDWAPTPGPPSADPLATAAAAQKSKYRAFNTQGQRAAQPFGSAPTEPRKGPFWFRVPPAPTTPAQRVFNPPNQPRLRVSPVGVPGQRQDQDQEGGVRFRGQRGAFGMFGAGGADQQQQQQQQQVMFAEPSIFAETLVQGAGGRRGEAVRSDPRNELTGMFGEAFRLDEEERRAREAGGWFKRFVGGGDGQKR